MTWMGHEQQPPGPIAEEERRQIEHDLEARAEEGAGRDQRVREAVAARPKRPLGRRIRRWLRGKDRGSGRA